MGRFPQMDRFNYIHCVKLTLCSTFISIAVPYEQHLHNCCVACFHRLAAYIYPETESLQIVENQFRLCLDRGGNLL